MSPPLVSIALTTLNGSRYIRESIASCLSQTYSNTELLIVDGGSTDNTLGIASSYSDPRVRIIHQQGNAGRLPGAINLGLSEARGDYLTWMQDDSIYHPRAVETMVGVLEDRPEMGHVYADYWQLNELSGSRTRIETCDPAEILSAKSDPCGVCFLIRRSTRDEVGPHDLMAYPSQDYDYRMRIARVTKSARIAEPLYTWRYHPGSLTGRLGWHHLAHTDVQIRLKLGMVDKYQALRQHGDINIDYAFASYQNNEFKPTLVACCSGLWKNPVHARNRGVWSIALRSLAEMIRTRFTNATVRR